MTGSILYCGDTHLRNAAAYLAGVLTFGGEAFHYVPSDQPLSDSDLSPEQRLIILSDYMAVRISAELQQKLVQKVEQGCGLLMIGGWESFHGLGGDWDGTPISKILPVQIAPVDDRLNSDRPLLVREHDSQAASHPVTANLPWQTRPPYVGGINLFQPRDDATVLLSVDRLMASRQNVDWEFTTAESSPLLVVGQYGEGRTAALATDLAPHWIGGMVDWGDQRVTGQALEADPVEVGNLYTQFILQLVRWTRGV